MSERGDSVGRVVGEAVLEFGADIFGVMGVGNALVVDEAVQRGGRYHALRHEAGALSAADAFTRVTGRQAVCTTTFGAGFSNTLTALGEAARAGSPVVVVTGTGPSTGPRKVDADVARLASVMGARTFVVDRTGTRDAVRSAFATAAAESRPSVVALPADIANLPAIDASVDGTSRSRDVAAPPSIPLAVLERIADARRPVILAGRGAVDSAPLLSRVAGKLGARTMTTVLAAGAFRDDSASLGIAGGFMSDEAVDVVHRADLVLVVGASLSEHTLRGGRLFSPRAEVVQVDVGARRTSSRVDHFVQADADDFLAALLSGLAGEPSRTSAWGDDDAEPPIDHVPLDTAGVLHPGAVADAVAGAVPDDATFVVDGGNFLAWPMQSWRSTRARAFVPAGLAFQSIGLGLGAFIGAAIGAPEHYPVLGVGDGGLLMSLADLESASRLVGRGAIVVFNDSAYGAELHQFGPRGFAEQPMRFPLTDFAAVAESVGIRAVRANDAESLRAAAEEIRRGDGLVLADCRTSRDVAAPFLQTIR